MELLTKSEYAAIASGLELPTAASSVEASLTGPIFERLFGDYEELDFLKPMRAGTLPPNVQLTELYFKAGSMKQIGTAQRNYISSNYTHIARDVASSTIRWLLRRLKRSIAPLLTFSPTLSPRYQ